MKKRNWFLLAVASLFLVQCNGVDSSLRSADAQEPSRVSTGDEESLSDRIPEVKNAALSGTTVAADAGFISDGAAIDIPTGFDAEDCRFTAAPARIDGAALSTNASVNTTSGVVTCKKVVQERKEVPPTSEGCVASYTIICIH